MPLSQSSGSATAYSSLYPQLSRLRICETLVGNGEPSKYESGLRVRRRQQDFYPRAWEDHARYIMNRLSSREGIVLRSRSTGRWGKDSGKFATIGRKRGLVFRQQFGPISVTRALLYLAYYMSSYQVPTFSNASSQILFARDSNCAM